MAKQLFFDDNSLFSVDNAERKYGKVEVVSEYHDPICSIDFCTGHVFKMQDGKNGDQILGHVADINNGGVVGFKSFEFDGSTTEIKIRARGNNTVGEIEVRTSIDGDILARIPTKKANFWEDFSAPITIPAGVHSLFFRYNGANTISICGFELI